MLVDRRRLKLETQNGGFQVARYQRQEKAKQLHDRQARRLLLKLKGDSEEEKALSLLKSHTRYAIPAAILTVLGFVTAVVTVLFDTLPSRSTWAWHDFPIVPFLAGLALFTVGIVVSALLLGEISTAKKYTNLPITAGQHLAYRKCRYIILAPIGLCAAMLLVSILVLAVASPFSSTLDPDGSEYWGNKPVEGELTLKIAPRDAPRIPGRMMVYSLEPVTRGKDAMELLARSFGVSGSFEKDRFWGQQVATDEFGSTFSFDPDSYYFFYNGKPFEERTQVSSAPESVGYISEERAEGIAIEGLRQRGILPDGAYVEDVEWYMRRDSSRSSIAGYDRDVVICRRIDGYDAIKIGLLFREMCIRVSVGDSGRVLKLDYWMEEPVPAGEERTISLSQAVERAREGNGTWNMNPEVVDPVITSVDLAYHSFSDEHHLWPAYVLSGPKALIYVRATE